MPRKRRKAFRPGPPSPYMRRKMALGTPAQRLLMPARDYNNGDLTTLRDFYKDFRKENGGRQKSNPPAGPHHRFYRLPLHQRDAAQLYYEQLCRKWASRIRKTPNFARILHMITLNKFKNPGQAEIASCRGNKMQLARHVTREKLQAKIYDAPQHSPHSGKITHLPTF